MLFISKVFIGRGICNLKLKKFLYFILLLTVPSGLRVRSGSKYDEDYDGQPLSGGGGTGVARGLPDVIGPPNFVR